MTKEWSCGAEVRICRCVAFERLQEYFAALKSVMGHGKEAT